MQRRVRNLLYLAGSIGLLLNGNAARAGTKTWDFSTDPTLDSTLTIGGNNPAIWQSTTGNPGGFLALTYSEGSQSAAVIFPDIDAGKVVTSFTFDCDLRIGNPQTTGPADGFSINFARISDPMIVNTPPDVTNAGVSGQPEDGTGTGIAIGFDTWSGNTLADGSSDLVGIIVSVDKVVILKQPMPTVNGTADDATSMQTGPRDGAYWDGGGAAEDPAAWAGLQWRHLTVALDTSGKLTITYKGKVLLDHFQTAYFPSAGRIVLMGRTGGSNENTDFDNITLTTTATADSQPPSAVANLKVTSAGSGHVSLSWDPSVDAPDATARVAYNIQRGGSNIVTALTTNSFTDFGVKPSSTYAYQVQSVDAAGNTSAFAPISATTVADVPSVGILKGEIFDNITGTTVDLLMADPTFTGNTPSRVTYVNGLLFGSPNGTAGFNNSYGDNYGARITGTITPITTGQYNFFIRSDDSSQFYLNTTGATLPVPGTASPLIEETGCCHAFLEPTDTTEPTVTTQTPVSLTAGTAYGFVVLLKEGGGGDGVAVAWRLSTDTTPAANLSPITGTVLAGTQDAVGASVTFTTSPQATTAIANEKVVFTAAATSVSPYGTTVGYQWFKNGTAIAGANGPTYTIPVVASTDSGAKFKVTAIGLGAQTTSAEVALTVNADTKAPTIASVNGDETGTILTIGFSEPVTAPSATTAANYTLSNGGTVTAAALADPFTVKLTTGKLTDSTVYTLTINNVKDNAGNSIAANSTFLFQSWGLVAGRAKMEQWNNITGTTIDLLFADPSYTGAPTVTRYLSGLTAGSANGTGGWNDSFGDNYGARIKAYIIPTVTGQYNFFIRSDDSSALFLSSNDTFPDPATATPTIAETGCCHAFLEPNNATEASVTTAAPISLTAGQKYAAVVILKEGGGGDGFAVGWRKVGDTNAAEFLPSITTNAFWSGPAPATNILAVGDKIVASSTNSPTAEIVANVLDSNSATKYLNFDKVNTGFTVTPKIGATVVTGIQLTTANDSPERDPASYLVEGSNDGATFTTIATGTVTHNDTRLTVLPAITFANITAYTTYRVTFPAVYNVATANSMQVADVALLGNPFGGTATQPPTGSSLAVAKTATGLTITYTGTLQSAAAITGPWTAVTGATSPYPVTASGKMTFYRTQQ